MSKKLFIPGITDEATLACIARSRKLSQYVKAVENALAGICPFCEINREYNQILEENEHWYAWPSKPAEDNTRLHFLFVPKRHVIDSEQLADSEILTLWGGGGIRATIRWKFGYTSRGTLMRDGDATLSAGTIQHLHIHDMVPNGTGRVESPFFKGAEAEKTGVARAIVFEKLRTGTQKSELDINELALVSERT